jgi:hypothetical protein
MGLPEVHIHFAYRKQSQVIGQQFMRTFLLLSTTGRRRGQPAPDNLLIDYFSG